MKPIKACSPPEGSIRDWIDHRALVAPDQVAFRFTDEVDDLTWHQLRCEVLALARKLKAAGFAKGESVAVMMPNGHEALVAFFAIVYGGFRATMINLAAGDEAISYALKHCEARLAFVGQDQLAQFVRTKPDNLQLFVSGDVEDGGAEAGRQFHEIEPADHALLMYTSGTTGTPKGVLHSHTSLLAGGWTTALAHALTSEDIGYCVLPICHINGLCVTVMATLVSGNQLLMAGRFSKQQFWSHVQTYKVTWFSIVPTIVSHLLHSEDEPSDGAKQRLRFGRSASAPLAPDVQIAFEQRFGIPIIETMGLTETAAQILSNPLPPAERKVGSPGLAFGNQVKICDLNGGDLANGEEGEILIQGPNVMLGYLKNEEATAETFTKEGWLRSGDLGRKDSDGYVFVTGRIKELIIKGGENIAPREIDEALYSHSDVVEAAAFPIPCKTYGERIGAAVCLRADSSLSPEALLKICEQRLGKFKSPEQILILNELPKGPSGKIQRRLVAEMASKIS